MLKKVLSVLKEISIIVLLCIIIILILGILFYDYIPINKTMPTQQAYVTPEEVKKEIEESISSETEKIEVTYEVTDSDLDMYKQSGSYTEGKANPFALSENLNNIEDTNDIKDTNQNTSGEQQGNNTNTFWNDEGIK